VNRQEAAIVLEKRKTRWPATPEAPDALAEVDEWATELAPFDVGLVLEVMLDHVGQFGLTLSEISERVKARGRSRRRAAPMPDPARSECPTCGRSPFGPHRGQDPCRTCGRDDAPEYARFQRDAAETALESSNG
jgi:hypothetical protein